MEVRALSEAVEVLVVLEVLVASVVVPVVVAASVAVPVAEAVEASAVLADSKERKKASELFRSLFCCLCLFFRILEVGDTCLDENVVPRDEFLDVAVLYAVLIPIGEHLAEIVA